MDVVHGHMREHQTGTSRRANHHRIFRSRQRGQDVPERHGFGATGAQGVLFDQFLVNPDILPAPALFPPGGVGHQVAVFRRHDVEELFTDLDAFFAHGFSPPCPRIRLLSQLPRPASVATDLPSDRWMCSTITSGGIVIPPATCGPAMTRVESGIVALISRAIQPATLNSGTKMCFAFFVASRTSLYGQGLKVLILTSPTRRPSSASRRIDCLPCVTAGTADSHRISTTGYSVMS